MSNQNQFDNALVEDIARQLNATQKLGEQAFAAISEIVKQQKKRLADLGASSAATLQNAEGRAAQAASNAANAKAAANASKSEVEQAKKDIEQSKQELASAKAEALSAATEADNKLKELQQQIANGQAEGAAATAAMDGIKGELANLQKQLAEMEKKQAEKDQAHKTAMDSLRTQKDEEKNAAVALAEKKGQEGMKDICKGSVAKALTELQNTTVQIAKLADPNTPLTGGYRSSSGPVKKGSLKKYRSSSRSYSSKGYKKNKNTKKIYFKPNKGKKSRK